MDLEALLDKRLDQKHLASMKVDLFDVAPVNWNNFESASVLGEEILRDLARDKKLLRQLIERAAEDPYLWLKCEQDVVEDKIVLWDDIDKNIRIRLRMSTAKQSRLAHCHRFSFTNLVLRGRYIHWSYQFDGEFNEHVNMDDIRVVWMHEDQAGDVFTIHHNALHSTPFTEVGTVSLVFRGNPVKKRAPVMFKELRGRKSAIEELGRRDLDVEPMHARAGDFFWRVGEDLESKERRSERQMTKERFDYWLNKLTQWEII